MGLPFILQKNRFIADQQTLTLNQDNTQQDKQNKQHSKQKT
jgi:hypothetical protein